MRVAIIGRPNVGKSTLFNRLVGKRVAIVDDIAGVTRDWRSMPGKLGDLKFELIDTAGLLGFEQAELFEQIETRTLEVLKTADIILFTVDGRDGLVANDEALIRKLRRHIKTEFVLVANKCETTKTSDNLGDFFKLGLGQPIPVSAEHGTGMGDLYDVLKDKSKLLDPKANAETDAELTDELSEEPYFEIDIESEQDEGDIPAIDFSSKPLNIAIIGRPNAGKSTLVNKLIGQDRLLTGDMPGVTRDSIHLDWTYNDRPIRLVDTAGMRRKARINERLEHLSVGDTLRSIRFAEVTVLVLDAECPLEKQDLSIAQHVINEGRALVIAVNKSDLVKGDFLSELRHELKYVLPQVKKVPCISISAKNGRNLDKLMEEIFKQEVLWNTRIGTSVLNQWLEETTSHHPPPLAQGKRIRLKYMTQIKTRPPTFVIFISKPTELPDSYLRYLMNQMREDFDLPGVPIRFQIRKGKNPYADKAK